MKSVVLEQRMWNVECVFLCSLYFDNVLRLNFMWLLLLQNYPQFFFYYFCIAYIKVSLCGQSIFISSLIFCSYQLCRNYCSHSLLFMFLDRNYLCAGLVFTDSHYSLEQLNVASLSRPRPIVFLQCIHIVTVCFGQINDKTMIL